MKQPRKAAARPTRTRARTLSGKQIQREILAERRRVKHLPILQATTDEIARPKTRGDCKGIERPCPFVTCKHHLYLDVNPETGSIKLNFPTLEPWELTASCALDVASRDGITLEEVGEILNLTRERIRQVEVDGLLRLRASGDLDSHDENRIDEVLLQLTARRRAVPHCK